jgi:hypothetical protein
MSDNEPDGRAGDGGESRECRPTDGEVAPHDGLAFEKVATPADGAKASRASGVVLDLLPKPADVDINGPRPAIEVVPPHLIEDLFS